MELNFSTWSNAIQQMGKWYEKNIHTYQGGNTGRASGSRKQYSCSLLNGNNVCDDCSGFTSACLQLAGVFSQGFVPNSSQFADLNGVVAQKLKSVGFVPSAYSLNSVKPGDIIAKSGHVEIYAGKINGSDCSWSWGNIHDGQGKHRGMPCYMSKDKYTVAWRLGGGGSAVLGGEGINADGMFGGYSLSNLEYNVPRMEQTDHLLCLNIANTKMNLLKELFEGLGIVFGSGHLQKYNSIHQITAAKDPDYIIKQLTPKNTAKIKYKNNMGTTGEDEAKDMSISEGIVQNLTTLGIASGFEGLIGDLNVEPAKITNAQSKSNGETVINILMNEFGFTRLQAAGFAGVFMAESGINPGAFNKEEKSGRGVGGQSQATAQKLAATSGYGAGIAQWTYQDRKSRVVGLLNSKYGKSYDWKRLENIPLEDQIRMVALEIAPSLVEKIKSSNDINQVVDYILRGYENGSGNGGLAPIEFMNKYTWAGGYAGLMRTRVGFAKSFL